LSQSYEANAKISMAKLKIKNKFKIQNPKQKFCNLSFMLCQFFVMCALSCVICQHGAYAQPLSSTELINNAKAYDGTIVIYAGEVVGDVMARGNYAWVNCNDGANAIGIWVEKKLVSAITHTGSYRSRGDWLEVTGIFNRSCRVHGGDLDIHAQLVHKVDQGRVVAEHMNRAKLNFFFMVTGILCLILILIQLKIR